LVEKQLDGEYKKWNDNCGFVDGQDAVAPDKADTAKAALMMIAESDEDEDGEEDDDGEDMPISIAEIPQAFSHFTYRYTRRKVLVCDLQGVLNAAHPPKFEFTDPVIHFKSRTGRRNVFGRTDRGGKGVEDFFKSHQCGPLCRMLNRRWVRRVGEHQRDQQVAGLEEQVSNLSL
jgi:hypothetical protein